MNFSKGQYYQDLRTICATSHHGLTINQVSA